MEREPFVLGKLKMWGIWTIPKS